MKQEKFQKLTGVKRYKSVREALDAVRRDLEKQHRQADGGQQGK